MVNFLFKKKPDDEEDLIEHIDHIIHLAKSPEYQEAFKKLRKDVIEDGKPKHPEDQDRPTEARSG